MVDFYKTCFIAIDLYCCLCSSCAARKSTDVGGQKCKALFYKGVAAGMYRAYSQGFTSFTSPSIWLSAAI
jgi:hypothetical protein